MRKKVLNSFLLVLACLFLVTFAAVPSHACKNHDKEKIGVLYLVHGGFDEISAQNEWDVSVQMFSHDPNHMVYKMIIWNSGYWPYVLTVGNAPKELPKYNYNYGRIGGFDPFLTFTKETVAKLQHELDQAAPHGVSFVVDYAAWMNSGDEGINHFAYPRYLYTPPVAGVPCTYCGEGERNGVVLNFSGGVAAFSPGAALKGKTSKAKAVIADVAVASGDWATGDAAGTIYLNAVKGKFATGEQLFDNASISDNSSMAAAVGTTHWENCDPNRYNVDGPVERMLDQGIDRLLLVDLTTGGVRFYKTYETIKMIKRALAANNSDIPVSWINDPTSLMDDSYPADPGWTATLGAPAQDVSVPLEGRPNPVISDHELAKIHVQAIEKGFSPVVDDAQTGVILLNHAINDNNQYYDPKIDDTLIINQNIKTQLLKRHQGMLADNIVGAFMGIKVNGQRTREMRGESLGEAWLYEVMPATRPAGLWGFFYWDALEYLKNKGVKHIVIGFPQITTDSVLNLVEIPNQIAKEVGYKNWIKWPEGDYATYPDYGHPFADYWGVWVKTDCGGVACCFEMGGCSDNRSYPPMNQPALGDLNPYFAYDVSEFGHLGYDAQSGAPNLNQPVQNQYTGTWAMYQPPNAKMQLVKMLKKHVLEAAGINAPHFNR